MRNFAMKSGSGRPSRPASDGPAVQHPLLNSSNAELTAVIVRIPNWLVCLTFLMVVCLCLPLMSIY